MTTIGSATPVIGTLTQTVYTRAAWADAWEEAPDLHCQECTWSLFPVLPTATFFYRYGFLRNPADTEFFVYDRWERVYRIYVKVVWSFDDCNGAPQTRTWYGLIQIDEDELLGLHAVAGLNSGDPAPTGRQELHAYGLEKLLADSPIRWAYWWDGSEALYTEILPDFNRRGLGNRTTDKVLSEDTVYAFAPQTDPAKGESEFWHTAAIVDYLLHECGPRNQNDEFTVPFGTGANTNGLVELTWDRPVCRQKDRSVFQVLQEDLVHHGKLLCAWFDVALSGDDERVELNTNTLTDAAVSIPQPGSPTIPANNSQRDLIFADDNYTRVVVKRSEVQMFDQIVCRGAPVVCVGSFSMQDGTLQQGWSGALQTEYEQGADVDAGWSVTRKREADRVFRQQPKFRDVFTKLIVPDDWDREVKDWTIGDSNPMFPPADGAQPYYADTFIEHVLPLLEGVDYSGDKIEQGTYAESEATDRKYMQPVLVWTIPNSSPPRYVDGNRLGSTADLLTTDRDNNNRWSGHVAVDGESHSIRVEIVGHEQHSAAAYFFSGYAKATDIPYGTYQIREAICTLAMRHAIYCEGVYPPDEDFQPPEEDPEADPAATPNGDVILRKVFNLGDDFTKVYVAPGTVLGVDRDGTLLRTTGGYIPKEGDDDNEHRLIAQAKMLHAYYSRQRRVVDVTSAWFLGTDLLQLGDLITTVGRSGDPTFIEVNSFVSSITFRHAQGRGDTRPQPQMHFATWAGEIDPVQPRPWKQMPAAAAESGGVAEMESIGRREGWIK